MRIAIMQPYFFPYPGYFQLIRAVDTFIFLDDVAFIKKGWIHRNRLFFNDRVHLFSIPLADMSQHRAISATQVSAQEFPRWREKFLASLHAFYRKQPYFHEGLALLEDVLAMPFSSIADLAIHSVRRTCAALGMDIPERRSSQLGTDRDARQEGRLIDICRHCGGDVYVNAPGGAELYTQEMFAPHGIRLEFLEPRLAPYPVKGRAFVPGLSILDALMCCGAAHVRERLLSGYRLREAA